MSTFRGLEEHELLGALNALHEGLQIVDREYRYVWVNESAAAQGRSSPELLVGRAMAECYPGIEHTEMFAILRRSMVERTSAAHENVFRYPDGRTGIFDLRFHPCEAGVAILSVDVGEQRRLEAQVRQSQKMEALGVLAGTVAHDFNNLLSVILSYTQMLQEENPGGTPLAADLAAIRLAGERGADLTRQLLALSRNQVQVSGTTDLNEQLRCAEPLWRRLMQGVTVVCHHAPAPVPVIGDPGPVQQIILNLLVNARDAMAEGGTVTVEVDEVFLDEEYAAVHHGVRPGRYGALSVTDTGCGMDQDTQSRIFEPFFTTKPVGKGTGLGLSTVFGIARQAGGHVWVYSEPGKGSCFRVYLPWADDAPAERPPAEPAGRGGGETILLVEDDPQVRVVSRQILERAGYVVRVAESAADAAEIARGPDPIHLLLTDVFMPGTTGPELAAQVRVDRPDLRVLYMSGFRWDPLESTCRHASLSIL